MKKNINTWQLMGFAVTSLGGTLLHFLYDWTGQNRLAAIISGVNESTWEHMKLLFFPMFFFALIQSFYFKEDKNFWCIKLKGILKGLCLIPIIFYTYNGVIGKSPDWFNIAIFFVAAAATYVYEARLLNKKEYNCKIQKYSFLILCLITALFVIFTFITPKIDIFKDPITGRYGI